MIKKSGLLDGNEIFVNSYFKKHSEELLDLVKNGQNPKALFIGCADSRVIPNLITQTAPGELFVLRNVGNFVAPYKPDEEFHSTATGIEYAVNALNVSEIIICGHTHCGAIASLYSELDDDSFIHTKKWLTLGEKPKALAKLALGKDASKEELLRLTEKLSVISQIENLLTYPYIKEGVANETIHIHGWMYDIQTGAIEYYDPDEHAFKSLIKEGDNVAV
ncbi:carbonic anhydrase [Sulfurimonas marina]|uniref:Carbonic anhydrase n=1 Tax=Sulfurimonas marina TaxID=2590551 RepID=A0A7M1AZ04_9BACT|nr:carbonic anhydrase [Sulfurimonas marina]QOP41788.1 carbonic anhydrase [Sulfurimonas marina]